MPRNEKLLLCADLHLSERTYTDRDVRLDSFYAMRQIVDLAIKHRAHVVAAGDLLDKTLNHSRVVNFLLESLRELDNNGLKWFFIQGQHDMASVPWCSAASNAFHLHKNSARVYKDPAGDYGISLYGLDWLPRGELQKELANVPHGTDLLVTHQVWHDFMGDNASPEGAFTDLPDHVPFVLTGDFHETHIKKMHGGRMTILSPGSSHPRSISEPSAKCVFLLDAAKFRVGDPRELTKIPLLSRPIYKTKIIDGIDMANLQMDKLGKWLDGYEASSDFNEIWPEVRKPLVQVAYHPSVFDIRKIRERFGDRAHWFWDEAKETKELTAGISPEVLAIAADTDLDLSLEGFLETEINHNEEPELFALASRCLATEDPRSVLLEWLQTQTKD